MMLPLSLRMLWRDWRGGELRLLAVAVVVAVAAVTSVAWLAERVAGATEARAADLLAADRAVEYTQPIPDAWVSRARELGLRTAITVEFPSIVIAGDQTQLVSAKAVSDQYPLRGELRVRAHPAAPETVIRDAPAPGTVWVEPRLLALLGLEIGDDLGLGQMRFEIDRLITLEPDRGAVFASLAPRAMFNYADLEATGLLGPGSRARYKLLLAGPDETLNRLTDALVAEYGNAVEIETPTGQGRGVGEVVEQAKRFLGLAALLTVIVAGVAVLLTVRHYAERQITAVAVMRATGATRRQVVRLFAGKLFWLGLIAGAVGASLGFVLHVLMLGLVTELIGVDLPPAGLRPLATGWITAFAALFGFALPTLLRLRDVPPMRVLRRDLGEGLFRGLTPLAVAVAVILALMAWQAGDARLTAYVFAALAGTVGVLALVAAATVVLVRRIYRRGGPGRLLWLTGLTRRPWTAVVQIVAVGLGLMALFLLAVVRNDLLNAWRDQIPPDAPNLFLINIQPEELDGVDRLLAQSGIDTEFYPMVRGRLVAMNGREVDAGDFDAARARELTRREFNLSWAEQPQPANRVIAGSWWNGDDPPPQLSLEEGVAEELGIELGDRLTFDVAGSRVSAEVSNLRAVQWDSFNVNFFVVASPGTLEGLPATWITSFYLPPERSELLTELVREYPSVTAFDVTAILRTIRAIVDQGVRVVELMALLTLAAGVLVLLAALQITGEERRFESALLRALGATGQRIRGMARLEFWLVGALAGAIAGLVATVAGVFVAEGLFDLSYPFRPLTVLAGAGIGLLTVWLAGGLGSRRFYRTSPMRLLREGGD
jgi:putative ABC transport system permease protein